MPSQDLIAELSNEIFLKELHHLFWLPPHVNRGIRDDGWQCREHALALASIAQVRGAEASLVHGAAMYVQSRSADRPPVGRKVELHTWARVNDTGSFDASTRLTGFPDIPDWQDWQVLGLFGSKYYPQGRVSYLQTSDQSKFENVVDAATHLVDSRLACYLAKRIEPLTAEIIRAAYRWCNSPLTDRLRTAFRSRRDLYVKAILHLLDILDGQTEYLSDLPRMDAWRRIGMRSGNAIDELCRRAHLQ